MLKLLFFLIVLGLIGGLAFIRFAPSDPDVWHVDPQVTADQDLASGVRRRIPGGPETLETLDRIILATPRTEIVAGDVASERVTYVTRTKWMGFPDYTTVQLSGDTLELYARQRFGKSDLGVNRARVEGWLAELRAAQGE